MELKVKLLGIESGKPIVIMDDEHASRLGLHPSDRIIVKYREKSVVAIVNVAATFPRKTLGVYDEVRSVLNIRSGESVEVLPAERPESLGYVRDKILGHRLRGPEMMQIIKDVVERHLSDAELAAFITALHIWGMSIDEAEALSRAMVAKGKTLRWNKGPILDKHSIGGVPGDKTTLLVVPIVAAAGFIIPKTSSRAITSPAGTADRVEVLCPVSLDMEEIRRVVNKTNACLAWGGALDLAPADDLFIQVEYSLSIDPLLLPSIISKKKAIGAEYVVIDIPIGRGAKMKTVGEAHSSARDFMELGKRLSMQVQCAVTFGEQPVGFAVGPALEAREALLALGGNGPFDLVNKATELAGILLEMMGVKDGKGTALTILKSGKADRKFREIVAAQGGNSEVTIDDIEVGDKTTHIVSDIGSRVVWISNMAVAQIARAAGAPKEKGAGVVLRAKLGDQVKKGDPLLTIYSGTNQKLEAALALAERLEPIGLSERYGEKMLIGRIPTKIPPEKVFVLER
jgi:AMP phosphorylase